MAKKATNLTEDQIASIKNYADNIVTIEDFIEAIRQMPGMYIGGRDVGGIINMIREIIQNSLDEIMRVDSPCNMIDITFDEATCTTRVEDNGRGIPFDNIIRVFTAAHTSSNYTKKPGEYTSGMHGVGAKVTNALSSMMVVESYILGEGRRVEFTNGKPWNKGEKKIPNKENKQGTVITFTPSFEVMGRVQVSGDDLLSRLLQKIIMLTPIGSKFYYTVIHPDGKSSKVTLENKDGIMAFMYDNCIKPMIKPISFVGDNGQFRANILLEYDSDITVPESILAFSNYCPTEAVRSTHVKGFMNGLKKFFINYMHKVYLNSISTTGKKKKKQLTIIESDIRTGLRVVIDAACLEPVFSGQAKEVLNVPEIIPFIEQLTIQSLEEWSKANPNDLQKMCKYFKEIAEIRSSTDEKRVKLSNQYSSTAAGYPSKYKKPTKEKKEFFIVEGDSAGGSFDNYRYNPTQGVFPIRGMIKNCFESSEKTCLENAEVAGILMIIGGGYGKNFNIDKVEWEKVIACTDADAAGAEIEALLLRLVLRFCPQLILAGKYYKTIAPLYYINVGRGKNKQKVYFPDRIEMVKYVQKSFSKKNTIATLDGKKLSANAIQELLYHNFDYIRVLEKIANRYIIDPKLLELYLINRDKTPEQICKVIHKNYRFMNKVIINGHVTCDGTIDGRNNTLILEDRMINDCSDILEIMEGNLYDIYLLNGKPATVLDIMRSYQDEGPDEINRLKGLGEQSGEELAESVILPGDMGNRTLLRYTMDSAMKEIDDIRRLDSNKSKLLEGLVVTRLDIAD